MRPGSCVVQSQACVRADKGGCERFSHFLLVCAAIRLVAPDRTRVICGIFYLEGQEGQRARTSLRVAFVLDPKFCWRGHGVPWSSCFYYYCGMVTEELESDPS